MTYLVVDIPAVFYSFWDAFGSEFELRTVNALFVLFAKRVELVDWSAFTSSRHCSVGQHKTMATIVPELSVIKVGVVVKSNSMQIFISSLLCETWSCEK